jgi:hypothetical protein
MDLKKLSEKYKSIKSPVETQSLSRSESNETNSLLEIIKKEDSKSKKQSKRFYIITSITTIVYVLIFIINPDPELTIKTRLAGSCFIFASLILAVLFWKKHSQIKETWYTSSPKIFLEEAKKRFQFWNRKQLWLIVVIVLVDVASMFSLSNYFESLGHTKGIIIYQLLFLSLMIFGFFMGKKEWQKNKKPIFTKIEEMLSGFEEEN